MNEPLHVVITNDDGVSAPGICELARAAVARGWTVAVAAPAQEASGSSAVDERRGDGRSVAVEERTIEGLDSTKVYAVAASPAFVAFLAVRGAFGFNPDLVMSVSTAVRTAARRSCTRVRSALRSRPRTTAAAASPSRSTSSPRRPPPPPAVAPPSPKWASRPTSAELGNGGGTGNRPGALAHHVPARCCAEPQRALPTTRPGASASVDVSWPDSVRYR